MIRETSRQAYAGLVLPHLGERQLEVYNLLCQHENLTNNEIKVLIGWEINCVTPRVDELRNEYDPPLVLEDGMRKCTVTGRTAHAWRANKSTLF